MISFRKSNIKIVRALLSIFFCLFICAGIATKSLAGYEDMRKLADKVKNNLVKEVIKKDALMVAQVVGWALEGMTDHDITAPVRFETTSAAPSPDVMIRNNNFSLSKIVITGYNIPKDAKKQRFITGLVVHSDPLGRIISTVFWTNYTLASRGRMIIHQTVVRKIDSFYPEVSLYFLPAEKFPHRLIKSNNYTDLLKYVVDRSVSFDNHTEIDRSERKYYAFAFFMERLTKDAKIDLHVSNRAVKKGKARTVGKDGWYAVYVPVRFAIDRDREILFKAVYTPGRDTPPDQRKERIVSVFTSDTPIKHAQRLLAKYGYKPGPADGIMGNRTRDAIIKFQQDNDLPVTLMSSASQPPIKEKASLKGPLRIKEIQLALTKKGYKPGVPDGIMGRGTRRAIMQYQRDHSMTADGKISASLLRKLEISGSTTASKTSVLKASPLSPAQKRLRSSLKTKMWPNELQAP